MVLYHMQSSYFEIFPSASFNDPMSEGHLADDIMRLCDNHKQLNIPHVINDILAFKHSIYSLNINVLDTESDLFYFLSSERSDSPNFVTRLLEIANTYNNQMLCEQWWPLLTQEEKTEVINGVDVKLTVHLLQKDYEEKAMQGITPHKVAEFLAHFRPKQLPSSLIDRYTHEKMYQTYGCMKTFALYDYFNQSNEQEWAPYLIHLSFFAYPDVDTITSKLSYTYAMPFLDFVFKETATMLSQPFKTPIAQYYLAFRYPEWGQLYRIAIPDEYRMRWETLHSLGLPLSEDTKEVSNAFNECPIILE